MGAIRPQKVTYKTVGDTPIEATILIPKHLLDHPGRSVPLSVRFHGGFLVTGHRLYADWYPHFMIDLYAKCNAIAISVDYRLMPEAKGADILEDVKDFFGWLLTPGNLASHLPSDMKVDLDNILVSGESAGGYLAFMSTMIAPSAIKAAVIHYPMLDPRDSFFTKPYVKHTFDPPVPQIPTQVLAGHRAGLKGNETVSSAIPLARVPLAISMVQQGLVEELLGGERALYPIDLLDDGMIKGSQLPPLWILHGKQDSAVLIEGTKRFLEKLREVAPDAAVHTSFEDGDHGFDGHAPGDGKAATLDTPWVAEGIKFVEKYWPAK